MNPALYFSWFSLTIFQVNQWIKHLPVPTYTSRKKELSLLLLMMIQHIPNHQSLIHSNFNLFKSKEKAVLLIRCLKPDGQTIFSGYKLSFACKPPASH